MDCPFCGEPLKEGNVFCETCGKEIQMVPVFEPEIEDHMQKSLDNVKELFDDPQEAGDKDDKENGKEDAGSNKKFKNYYFAAFGVGTALFLVCLIFIIRSISEYHSYDYQMQAADKAYTNENYEEAVKHVLRAAQIAPNSSDAKMLLAACYIDMGEETEAQEILEELLANDVTYVNAYKPLIALYEEKKAYDKINELLKKCSDMSIVEQFQDYTAAEPQFSEEEGTYDSILSLKILAAGNGEVYYTLDGTMPDASSEKYLGPIQLDGGTYQVQAIFINGYGVSSEVASAMYVIELATPDEPEISVESGTYYTPQMIETFLGGDFEIYYTTDGTEPSRNSNPYLVPIPMPLGHSVFKFVMYNDEGVASHIATREYDLQLNTTLSTEVALVLLKQALIQNGSIMDMQGHVMGMTSYKEYELKSAFTENDQIFYLITEYMTEMDQTRSKTGNQYAVNIETNEIYRASTNYAGYYVVESFN